MPEGDTIFRAARTLQRALAGRTVTRFDSVYPQLTNVDVDTPVVGRTIVSVSSRGKRSAPSARLTHLANTNPQPGQIPGSDLS